MAWSFQRRHRLGPRVSGLPARQDPLPHTHGTPPHPHSATALFSPPCRFGGTLQYFMYSNYFNYISTIIDRTSKWMEAIPLSEKSAVACAKALPFTWILHFGVSKTITSDSGPQFTSRLWFQLCEVLNISHKQTTAYHPESNGAVERLHRRLKNALRACAAAATWSKDLPFVLFRLGAQPREDTGLSPAEPVFGAQNVLPNEFLQNEELSADIIVKIFSKTVYVSAPSLPRHNSSTDLPSELPAELLSAPLVWVRRGSLVPPLQLLYDGSYAVLCRGPRSFTIRVRSWDKVVAVSRLKACTAVDVKPGSPRRLSRPLGSRPCGPAATKWVSFLDPLVSSPSSSPAPPQNGPETVFLPGEEVFAHPGPAAPSQVPQTQYPSCQRAPPKRLDL
jgi:transposase InsO family protein